MINSENSLFIFLGCRKRTGKDTVAELIRKEYLLHKEGVNRPNIYKLSCIQYARNTMSSLLPDLPNDDNKDTGTLNNHCYRDVIIDMVDSFIKVDELCFSKHLLKYCENILLESRKYSNTLNIFLIPDLRRKTEIDFFKKELGSNLLTVLVERDLEEPRKNEYAEGSLDNYEWDIIIDNNGTYNELEILIEPIISIIDNRLKIKNNHKEN